MPHQSRRSPFPFPAHQTGRADFPHPAFRLVSWQGRRNRPHVNPAKPEYFQFAEDHSIRKADGASRGHFVASPQKMSDTLQHVVINRSIGHQPGTLAEVRRPAPQNAVQSIPYLGPSSDIAGHQEVSHLPPKSRHALLRRTGSQIPMAILPEAIRPERVTEKVETFSACLPNAGLRFVQSDTNLMSNVEY